MSITTFARPALGAIFVAAALVATPVHAYTVTYINTGRDGTLSIPMQIDCDRINYEKEADSIIAACEAGKPKLSVAAAPVVVDDTPGVVLAETAPTVLPKTGSSTETLVPILVAITGLALLRFRSQTRA